MMGTPRYGQKLYCVIGEQLLEATFESGDGSEYTLRRIGGSGYPLFLGWSYDWYTSKKEAFRAQRLHLENLSRELEEAKLKVEKQIVDCNKAWDFLRKSQARKPKQDG